MPSARRIGSNSSRRCAASLSTAFGITASLPSSMLGRSLGHEIEASLVWSERSANWTKGWNPAGPRSNPCREFVEKKIGWACSYRGCIQVVLAVHRVDPVATQTHRAIPVNESKRVHAIV